MVNHPNCNRKPHAAPTFHLLDVVSSLEEQNSQVGLLLQAVHSFVSLNETAPGVDLLREAADKCRAAMWPEETDTP